MVEIGRIDMITEVSMMTAHMAMPREGHLDNIFHMFAYLKIKHNSRMVFDPSYLNVGDQLIALYKIALFLLFTDRP